MTFSLACCVLLSISNALCLSSSPVSPLLFSSPSLLVPSLLFLSLSLSLSLPLPPPPFLSPQVLEETLRCDTTMAATFAAIGSRFDYIADVKEDL